MKITGAIPLVALLGALAACTGGDGQTRPVTQSPTPSPTPTSTSPTRQGDPQLGSQDSPASYIARYVHLLDAGNRDAAISIWLDGASVPRTGTRIFFEQHRTAHPADRSGMGMGTDAYRYIVAVPGSYRETTLNGVASPSRSVNFLLVRSSRQQPWSILGVQNARR